LLANGDNAAQGALALSGLSGVVDRVGPRAARGASAPGRAGKLPLSTAAAEESGPTAGGGFVATLVGLVAAIVGIAVVTRRRRRSRPG
jgi:hypothetical protein